MRYTVLALIVLLSASFSDSATGYDDFARLFLEIWGTATMDSVPADLEDCQADIGPIPPHVWEHNSHEFVWVVVRIGNIPDGYSEVQFGLWNECSPEQMRFLGFRPCPGFMQLPMLPGPPTACFVWLPSGCKGPFDYVGYFIFMASPGASCRFVVTPNAYTESMKVKKCNGHYYPGATARCCAQYSGTQTVEYWNGCHGCDDVVDVKDTTWGRIKTLYR